MVYIFFLKSEYMPKKSMFTKTVVNSYFFFLHCYISREFLSRKCLSQINLLFLGNQGK